MANANIPRRKLAHERPNDFEIDRTPSLWRRLKAAVQICRDEYCAARAAERRIDALIRMHASPQLRRHTILNEFYAENGPRALEREPNTLDTSGESLRARPLDRWRQTGVIGVGTLAIAAMLSAPPALASPMPAFAECGRFFGYVEFDHDPCAPGGVPGFWPMSYDPTPETSVSARLGESE